MRQKLIAGQGARPVNCRTAEPALAQQSGNPSFAKNIGGQLIVSADYQRDL